MSSLIKFFSSLKLTVWLLTASMLLVFFGTLDQVHFGIWQTQKLYFESFFVVWSYPEQWGFYQQLFWLRLPLPGGYLLGGLLLINLVAAHLTRFQLSFKKCGLFLIHFGLILLIFSELLTDLLAHESRMAVSEGQRSNYSENFRANELVLINRQADTQDTVHAISSQALSTQKAIVIPETELTIRCVRYFSNSSLIQSKEGGTTSPADKGLGARTAHIQPKAISYSDDEVNTVSAYVEVSAAGTVLGTWLVSNVIDDRYPPQIVNWQDQEWELALRFQRSYYPFEFELIDFKHDKYPGTEIPFNFSSEVQVHHQKPNLNQRALIYMNHPLRYAGLTFYQASFADEDTTSIFQVVRNPGWLLPYISVLLMGLGMCLQFGLHFYKFLRKRRGSPSAAQP
tara:strand:+ start:1152 stop:2342 length:1191 start_codon:yes stop_codon:yes gene_type:complete